MKHLNEESPIVGKNTIDGVRKTAIFLLSLDQGLAAEVLGKLPREQVERVTLAIAKAENVTREEQESILIEFKTAYASRPLIHQAGPETARELLERTLDRSDAESAQQRIDEQVQAGPFSFLHDRHPDDVRRMIADEHPQTIAVVTAQLPPALAAKVLSGFNDEIQTEILGRLAQLGPTDVDVLAEIAMSIQERIGQNPVRISGMSQAADVLRESQRKTSQVVLSSLENKNTDLAQNLREQIFSFKDLQTLDDSTLRQVLEGTANCSWGVALKGSPEVLRKRILACLSNAVSRGLQEEMNSAGPLRLSEITAAQRQIAETVLKMESDELIELPRPDHRSRKPDLG